VDVDRPPFADARRSFVSALAVTLLRPRVVHAQEHRIYRIAMLEAVPAARNAANLAALRRGLRERGYVEGRNLVIEYRSADGHADRFPALAAEVVRLGVDLIIARGTPATTAAKRATQTVPVVMATMGDAHPLVASFAHPGGNVTGLTTFSTELSAKRIELLAELDSLVVGADGLTQLHLHRIVGLANEAHLPAAYPGRDFVEAGGLIAYGVDYPDLYYRFASYVDRILKGARPGDLPVEQPARFELVINAGTARELGLTVPTSLRLRANEVIE
jgi:putative ABC transport system substrate-binding protein